MRVRIKKSGLCRSACFMNAMQAFSVSDAVTVDMFFSTVNVHGPIFTVALCVDALGCLALGLYWAQRLGCAFYLGPHPD